MASRKNTPATATASAVALNEDQKRELIQKAMVELKASEFDAEQQIFDFLDAMSIDDILDSQVIHLEDIIGTPMTVKSAQLQDSTYENSMLPAYAVMRVEFDDGTTGIVTTGATQIVSALLAIQTKGWFPFRCNTVELQTSGGNRVFKLVKAQD